MKVQVARSTAERGALIMRRACALERATILFPALSLSLFLSPLLPWRHLQVQRPTYRRVTVASRGQLLCVVATWSRHARLHIKRRSSSSRRQTEPTHSKRGRNRTPSRPQKTDDRTHLHACPVCRVSLSRPIPPAPSIVSYDEWHLILFCVKLRGCRWRRSSFPLPLSLPHTLHDHATFGDTRTGWERFCIWFLACLVSCSFGWFLFFGKIFLCGAHLSRWVPDSWYFGGASSRGHTYCRISVSGPPCALSCFGTWVPQRGPLLCAWVNQSWQLPHTLSFSSLSLLVSSLVG